MVIFGRFTKISLFLFKLDFSTQCTSTYSFCRVKVSSNQKNWLGSFDIFRERPTWLIYSHFWKFLKNKSLPRKYLNALVLPCTSLKQPKFPQFFSFFHIYFSMLYIKSLSAVGASLFAEYSFTNNFSKFPYFCGLQCHFVSERVSDVQVIMGFKFRCCFVSS